MPRAPSCFRLSGSVGAVDVSFPLAEGPNQVGADALSHLVIRESGVSRRHALVLVEPDRVVVIDEGSKNGTYVQGRRIRQSELAPGETVAFGPVQLRLEGIDLDDARLAVEVAAEGASATPLDVSTGSLVQRHDLAGRWLGLLARLVHELARSGPMASTRGLRLLVDGLDLGGAALVDVAGVGKPGVLATHRPGAASLETATAELQRLWRRGGAGPIDALALGDGSVAGWVSSSGLALVWIGEAKNLEVHTPFLRAALEVWDDLGPEPPALRSPTPEPSPSAAFPPGFLPAESPAMRELYRQMRSVAPSLLPVLLLGETGVGKEHLAKAVHLWSARSDGPLVTINCAAVPASLLEAELFGIGARVATGVAERKGRFAEAAGGTLFLDEIGEMPPDLQAKLLRVLQERRLEPLGLPSREIDVRVVAATNADVARLLADGRLRRDLYFRLAGLVVRVPPLRDRPEDVAPLVELFVQGFAATQKKPIRGVTVRGLARLSEHSWPGNVRELRSTVERLVWLCPPMQAIDSAMVEGAISMASELAPRAVIDPEPKSVEEEGGGIHDTAVLGAPLLDLVTLERRAIVEALEQAAGNQVRAARLLGISRHQLRRRLQRLGLENPGSS